MTDAAMDAPDPSQALEQRALDEWLVGIRREVLAVARRFVPVDDAEDIAQRVTTALAGRYAVLRLTDARAYAIRCTLNAIRSESRRARRARRAWERLREIGDVGCTVVPLWDADERAERAMMLAAACAALPRETRAAALGAFVDGIDAIDLARSLGTSPGTIRQRMSRARRALRADPRVRACDLGPGGLPARPYRVAPDIDRWLRVLRALAHAPPTTRSGPVAATGVAAQTAAMTVLCELESGRDLSGYVDIAGLYGDALCADGRWDDAGRWFGTLAAVSACSGDRLGVGHARVWQGHASRRAGRSFQALGLYRSALAIADSLQHGELATMARFGEARVAAVQGRLSESSVQLDALIHAERTHASARLCVMIMSDRAALFTRAADRACDWGEADHLSLATGRLIMRVLDMTGGRPTAHHAVAVVQDIGAVWIDVGFLDEGMGLLEYVYSNSTDIGQRAAALTNLVIGAARCGAEVAFNHWVTMVEQSSAPPILRAEAVLNVGLGCMAFGRQREAASALRRSLSDARAFGFMDVAVRTRQAMAALEAGRGRAAAGWPPARGPRTASGSRNVRAMRTAMEERLPALRAAVRSG